MLTSPRVKTQCDLDDSSLLSTQDQPLTVENKEPETLPTKTTKEVKAESDQEDHGAQQLSVPPDTAQHIEEEESGVLESTLKSDCLKHLPSRVLRSQHNQINHNQR